MLCQGRACKIDRFVSSYKVKNGDVKEIARGDPQKPQTFYPMEKHVKVQPGDFLVARCTFNSMTMDKATRIGKEALYCQRII